MIKDLMLSYGNSEEDIDGIITSYSLAKFSPETLEKKIKENYEFLLRLGYSKEDVIKMTKTQPAIYGSSIENMQQKIDDMETLGYSIEDIIKMTKTQPSIYGYSIENMKQKKADMEVLG